MGNAPKFDLLAPSAKSLIESGKGIAKNIVVPPEGTPIIQADDVQMWIEAQGDDARMGGFAKGVYGLGAPYEDFWVEAAYRQGDARGAWLGAYVSAESWVEDEHPSGFVGTTFTMCPWFGAEDFAHPCGVIWVLALDAEGRVMLRMEDNEDDVTGGTFTGRYVEDIEGDDPIAVVVVPTLNGVVETSDELPPDGSMSVTRGPITIKGEGRKHAWAAQPDVYAAWLRAAVDSGDLLIGVLLFMSCKGLTEQHVIPPKVAAKRRRNNGGTPVAERFSRIVIPGFAQARAAYRSRSGSSALGTVELPRHLVRGHVKQYRRNPDGSGGLGKHHAEGSFWWAPQIRGNPERGTRTPLIIVKNTEES